MVSTSANATSASAAPSVSASRTLTRPLVTGRCAVRLTWRSKSRSATSFTQQPALRITMVPATNTTSRCQPGKPSAAIHSADSVGHSSSSQPAGPVPADQVEVQRQARRRGGGAGHRIGAPDRLMGLALFSRRFQPANFQVTQHHERGVVAGARGTALRRSARQSVTDATRGAATASWRSARRRWRPGCTARASRRVIGSRCSRPTGPQYLVMLWGIWWSGAAAVPINAKLHAARGGVDPAAQWRAAGVLRPRVAATALASLAPDGASAHRVAGAGRCRARAAPVERADTDPAWLFYTSGTTGRPERRGAGRAPVARGEPRLLERGAERRSQVT